MARNETHNAVTSDPWASLRSLTPARIAVGRAGGSLPTHEWLAFKAAHAAARNAVHFLFDADEFAAALASSGLETVVVDSAASDRRTFLVRPDLGRQLDERSRYALQQLRTSEPIELTIIVSDGLSAIAVARQARPLIEVLVPKLNAEGWKLGPLVIARFGRVALQDEVGQILGAQLALILIGERPGLGSADSLGAYLVYGPRVGNSDSQRNCVSNIRPTGLRPEMAADALLYLLRESRRRQLSGVQLKDERTTEELTLGEGGPMSGPSISR